jgi:uncharacterized protein YacL
MTNNIIRVVFVLSCILMGGLWPFTLATPSGEIGSNPEGEVDGPILPWVLFGCSAGGGAGLFVLLLLRFVSQELFERISPVLISIVIGLIVGFALAEYFLGLFWDNPSATIRLNLRTTFMLLFGFAGISLGLNRAASFDTLVQAVHGGSVRTANLKLVDTSVLIDGRISEVCGTGFVDGTLIIPRFIIKELQHIADSADALRRVRGRRGLDILKALQAPESNVIVEVVEDDPEQVKEVDGKLVELARQYGAKILTNDLNLNKVAQIDNIDVLNLNDLANALKPAVLPDEQMHVKIVKEGKEALQGVGYLDDGTMVVVDGGREYVGKQVAVLVTSVLQTSAGRMIFSKMQSVLT